MAATYQGNTGVFAGISGVTVLWPTGVAIDDILLLFCESTGGQVIPSVTGSAATQAANSTASTGATTAGTKLTIYWARAWSSTAGQSMPSFVVGDPGDHVLVDGMLLRGAKNTDDPYDVAATSVKATTSTACSAPSVTTTAIDELVVHAISLDVDTLSGPQYGTTGANANLTGLTKQFDVVTTQGNGGGISVWTGVKATAGATGTLTATSTPSTINAAITTAIKNATGTTPPDPRWRSSATTVQSSFVQSQALTLPESIAAGDLLVACGTAATGGVTMSPSAGWTQLFTPAATAATTTVGVWWRIATATVADALTLTSNGFVNWTGVVSRFTGHDATNPIPAYTLNNPTTGSNPLVCPSVTTTTANNRIVRLTSSNGVGQLTPAAGSTVRGEANVPASGGQTTIYVDNTLQASAGASSTFSVTTPAFLEQYTISLAIQPQQAGPTYTDSVQTDVLGVTSEVDLLALTETPQTTVVGVTSETDTRAVDHSVQTDVLGVTSDTDTIAATHSLQTDVLGVTSETDVLSRTESLQTDVLGVTSETDLLALTESVQTNVLGITSITEVYTPGASGTNYTDSVQTDVVGTSSIADTLAITTSVQTDIVMVMSESDTLGAVEAPLTVILGVSSVADQLAIFELPVTTGIISTGVTDSQGFYNSIVDSIVAITTETDLLAMGQATLQTDVLAITSVVDLQSSAGNESVQTDVTAVTSITEVFSANDTLTTTVTALTGETDVLAMYVDLVTTILGITFETEILGLLESLTTTVIGDTGGTSDRADLVSSLLTIINADTTESDILNGVPPPITGHLLYQAGPFKVMGKI